MYISHKYAILKEKVKKIKKNYQKVLHNCRCHGILIKHFR